MVCGHIHNAEVVHVDGMIYCNDGDWVESCTALVEDQGGELSLLKWRPSAAAIASSTMAAASATAAGAQWAGARIAAASRSEVD